MNFVYEYETNEALGVIIDFILLYYNVIVLTTTLKSVKLNSVKPCVFIIEKINQIV